MKVFNKQANFKKRPGNKKKIIAGRAALAVTVAAVSAALLLLPQTGLAGTNQWTTNGPYGGDVNSLAISPDFASDHTLFTGTFGGGVFVSTNGGGGWSAANNGIPANTIVNSLTISPGYAADHAIFAGTGGGVFDSTNGGASWSAANTGLTSTSVSSLAVSPDFASDQTLFAGTGGGVFVSTNGGASWSVVNTGLSSTNISSLAISPDFASDQTLFAGTYGGVFESTNAGASWSAANTGLTSTFVNSLAISPGYAADQTIFAGTEGGGVFVSTNGGASWSAASMGLTAADVNSLAISPGFASDQTIFAGTEGGGVFVSANGGASWSVVNTGLGYYDVYSLAISPGYAADHAIFAGTGGGVFESTNGGSSWSAANTGLTSTDVRSLAVSPGFASDHTLFAGTGGGAFSYTFDTTPPVVTNIQPTGTISTTSTTVSADYADNAGGSGINAASVAVYLDGSSLSGCSVAATSVSCPVTGLTNGPHTISGSVSDNAGNRAQISGSFTVALARSYFWTWYDNIGMKNWVLLANPAAAPANLQFSLTVAGKSLSPGNLGAGPGVVPPGRSLTPTFAGLMGGPVQANSLSGGGAIVSQRSLLGSSMEEVPGVEGAKLSDHFWWTWYDQESPGYRNWVLISNPAGINPGAVYYQVTIAGKNPGPGGAGQVASGQNVNLTFPGKMGGPVEVKAWSDRVGGSVPADVMASQRVLSNGGAAFNEVPGTRDQDLGSDYHWTWYDNASPGATDWVLVANPNSSPVSYQIRVAGSLVSSGLLGPGQRITPTFPGKMGGPVEVSASGRVIASQRSVFGPSFEEVPGLGALTSSYNWTWYDNASPGMTNWVLIANPTSSPLTATIKVGGATLGTYSIAPGANVTPTFPGKIGGPVAVSATANVIASQRVLYNGYFNEVLGQ